MYRWNEQQVDGEGDGVVKLAPCTSIASPEHFTIFVSAVKFHDSHGKVLIDGNVYHHSSPETPKTHKLHLTPNAGACSSTSSTPTQPTPFPHFHRASNCTILPHPTQRISTKLPQAITSMSAIAKTNRFVLSL